MHELLKKALQQYFALKETIQIFERAHRLERQKQLLRVLMKHHKLRAGKRAMQHLSDCELLVPQQYIPQKLPSAVLNQHYHDDELHRQKPYFDTMEKKNESEHHSIVPDPICQTNSTQNSVRLRLALKI